MNIYGYLEHHTNELLILSSFNVLWKHNTSICSIVSLSVFACGCNTWQGKNLAVLSIGCWVWLLLVAWWVWVVCDAEVLCSSWFLMVPAEKRSVVWVKQLHQRQKIHQGWWTTGRMASPRPAPRRQAVPWNELSTVGVPWAHLAAWGER